MARIFASFWPSLCSSTYSAGRYGVIGEAQNALKSSFMEDR